MTGRGIDQVLPHPSDPRLREPYVDSALEYVVMAENRNGPVPKPVHSTYIWGDAMGELDKFAPEARLINLETAITTSDEYEPKGINYRMHPGNIACLTKAKIDCCAVANNHVLDWSRSGLLDTLAALHEAGLATAGAGRNLAEALEPAVKQTNDSRVLVFAAATEDSGVPPHWAATDTSPGIALLPNLSSETADSIAERLHAVRRPGDVIVLSIHWGGNWGYEIPGEQRAFAHHIVGPGSVDILYGHSSHHPKAIEVYQNRLILYGCGDFLNDYEGIGGYEEFRCDLVLMYFVTLDRSTGELIGLTIAPFQIKRFRLRHAEAHDAAWLKDMLNREGKRTGTQVVSGPENHLLLQWSR